MDQERWHRLQDLLRALWPLAPEERGAYLEEHCRDPELHAKAEALLVADEEAEGFFERLAGDAGVARDGESSRLATIRLDLARALVARGQDGEASRLLDEAIPVLQTAFGPEDPRSRDASALSAHLAIEERPR